VVGDNDADGSIGIRLRYTTKYKTREGK